MPDDDVFRTDFRGSKFSWSIIDRVMIASACGKFRKCIFCIPNRSAKNGINMQNDKFPAKTIVL